jgi:hypothetical protein
LVFMPAVTVALILLTLCGHTALWVGLANRFHSIGLPRTLVKAFSGPCELMLFLLPLAAVGLWWRSGLSLAQWCDQAVQNRAVWCYLLPCWTLAGITSSLWLLRHGLNLDAAPLRENHTDVIDVAAKLGYKPVYGMPGRILSRVPGNQVLQIAVQQIQLELPRLPPELDGLSIALLSDLHYTGHIGIEFYQEAIQQANALRADIVAVCGDIVDEVEFLAWIPTTLGRLSAPRGVYFVLGNHDMFTDEVPQVRRALTEAGLVDLGGRWLSLQIAGAEVILAGNELPWLKPAAPMETCPSRAAGQPQLRILLSHSPDQLPWARRWDFDLMMAGHTHGGQFRLPVVGPIFSPSWHGVKYAGGTFYFRPTVMHVTRGISAELPLRLNCRPELTKLILRSPKANSAA